MKKRIILPLIMLSLGIFGLGSCDMPIISTQESTPESSSDPTSSSEESTNSSESVITHNFGTSWEKDETHHWHACSDEGCNEISDKALHSGGTATEEAKAVCEVCGESYGSLKPHEHAYTVELAEEEYLVSEADCDSKAVYFKSCACGEKGTETFEYGEVLGHDYDTPKSNETHHWDECSCGVKTNEEEHEYSISKSDSINHWDECACGVKANEEAHDYVANKNETHHWKECECGEEAEKEEHKYTYAYTKDEETLKYTGSCACGYAVSGDVSGDTLEISTEADLKMVLSSNYNVVLANDIALTSTIVLDGDIDVTIDLNGNSLTLYKEEPELNERVEVFLVKNNAKLTIEGEGSVSTTVSEDNEVSCYVEVLSAVDGAKVTIKGGSYYSNGCTAIYATRGAIIDIYGGTFEAIVKWNGSLYTLDVNEAETNIGIINVYGGTYANFDPANHTNDGENYTNKVQEGYCSVKNGDNYVVEEHVVVTDEAVEETCTTDGKTEGSHCSRCNHVFVEQELVPAIGHDYAIKFDDENHWEECKVCEVTNEKTAHSLLVEKDELTHSYYCECGYESEKTAHDAIKYDENGHYNLCQCGYETELEAHTLSSTHKENLCFKACSCGYETEKASHDQSLSNYITISFVPHIDWKTDNPRFVLYTFGKGNDAWYELTKINDNLYEVVVDSSTFTGVIFVRMNPNSTDNNWDNKWNQTVDLTVGLYTEFNMNNPWDDNQEGKATGVWTTQTHSHCFVRVEKDATCTESGVETHYACRCGKLYKKEGNILVNINSATVIPALGHTEEVVKGYDATCTTDGLTDGKKCSVCLEEILTHEVIPALGHSEEILEAVAPTCTTTGLTEGLHCSVCKVVFTAQEVVEVLGHSCGDFVSNENGTHTKNCMNTGCTHSITENCDYTWTVTVAPSSFEEGEELGVCKECGYEVRKIIAPTHTCEFEEEYTVDKDPTCTEDGSKSRHCSHENCDGKIDVESIEKIGHEWDEGIVTTQPTCTTTGIKIYTCLNDSQHTYTEEVAVVSHSYSSVVTAPTCIAKGYTTHTCICGDSYVDSETDMVPHNLVHVDHVLTNGTWYSHKECSTLNCSKFSDVIETNLVTIYYSPIAAFSSTDTYAFVCNSETSTSKFVKMNAEASGLLKVVVPASYPTILFVCTESGVEPSFDDNSIKAQTIDLSTADASETKKYITDSKDENGKYYGCWINTNQVAVYFEDNWKWHKYGKVNIYIWGSKNYSDTSWPGEELTHRISDNDVGYYRYRVIVANDVTGILFNGTGQYGDEQSNDITGALKDYYAYYMTWDDKTQSKPCGRYDLSI